MHRAGITATTLKSRFKAGSKIYSEQLNAKIPRLRSGFRLRAPAVQLKIKIPRTNRSGFRLRAPASALRPRSRPQCSLIWGCRLRIGSPVYSCNHHRAGVTAATCGSRTHQKLDQKFNAKIPRSARDFACRLPLRPYGLAHARRTAQFGAAVCGSAAPFTAVTTIGLAATAATCVETSKPLVSPRIPRFVRDFACGPPLSLTGSLTPAKRLNLFAWTFCPSPLVLSRHNVEISEAAVLPSSTARADNRWAALFFCPICKLRISDRERDLRATHRPLTSASKAQPRKRLEQYRPEPQT
jgi:hypothetical protein